MSSSDYIALATTFIALFAFLLTIFQVRATKRHNILLVRPLLRIHIERSDSLIYTIENHGLGSALIESFILLIGGKTLINPSLEQFVRSLSCIYGDDSLDFDYEYHLSVVGAAYQIGTKAKLLQFKFRDTRKGVDLYEQLENQIELRVFFQSMYKEKVLGCGTKQNF